MSSKRNLPRILLARALAPALCLCLGLATQSGGLEGRVILAKSTAGKPSKEVSTAQVYFTPRAPATVTPPEEPFEIVTVGKELTPRTLTIPVGSTVRFPNRDTILHNVFSVSGKNRFDLGLYRRGAGKSTTFDHPGVVRVFCNVHHSMVAYLVVVETPFTTSPEPDGRFRLDGLPAGPGTLTVWHERAKIFNQELTLPLSEPLEIRLEVSRPRVPRHTNKFGKPYTRRRSGKAYR